MSKQSNESLKTSAEWLKDNGDLVIYDPDGWDRNNFDYSFNIEKISKQEFNMRLMRSTLICKQDDKDVQ